jgi:hypothetical protein
VFLLFLNSFILPKWPSSRQRCKKNGNHSNEDVERMAIIHMKMEEEWQSSI